MDQPNISLADRALPSLGSEMIVDPVVSKEETVREIFLHPTESSMPDSTVTGISRPLHRIAEVRQEQNISLTRAAKKLSIDITLARQQELKTSDLRLSQLYQWRDLLQVPVAELVIEPDEIPNNPIKTRSQLIKMMKTVRAMIETSKEEGIIILAQLLADQLIELMPELKSISAWPSVGQSREQRDLGQAAYRRFDASVSRKLDE